MCNKQLEQMECSQYQKISDYNNPLSDMFRSSQVRLGDDFTSYIVHSEQVPSSVGVGVLVNPDQTIQAAGGFIIQLLPGTNDETIMRIEERLKEIMPISSMVEQGMTPEQILEQVLGAENVKFLERDACPFPMSMF